MCFNILVIYCRCGNFKLKENILFVFVEFDNKVILSDYILNVVFGLLKKEVFEYGCYL